MWTRKLKLIVAIPLVAVAFSGCILYSTQYGNAYVASNNKDVIFAANANMSTVLVTVFANCQQNDACFNKVVLPNVNDPLSVSALTDCDPLLPWPYNGCGQHRDAAMVAYAFTPPGGGNITRCLDFAITGTLAWNPSATYDYFGPLQYAGWGWENARFGGACF